MPSGHPGSGEYAGRGLQWKTVMCPRRGRMYNAHYDRYTGHKCSGEAPLAASGTPRHVRPRSDAAVEQGSILLLEDVDTGSRSRCLFGESWVRNGEADLPNISSNTPLGRQLTRQRVGTVVRTWDDKRLRLIEISGATPSADLPVSAPWWEMRLD